MADKRKLLMPRTPGQPRDDEATRLHRAPAHASWPLKKTHGSGQSRDSAAERSLKRKFRGPHGSATKRLHRVSPKSGPAQPRDDEATRLRKASDRALQHLKNGVVVSVYSNRGGVGKTTLSVSCAWELAMTEKKVRIRRL